MAYLLAAQNPERVQRLVVEDVSPPYPREASPRERPAGELPLDWDAVTSIAGQIDNADSGWWDLLSRITAPTLLIAGGPTRHIPQGKPVDVAERLHDATLITIPAGHHIRDSRPDEFTATVLDFLRPRPRVSH